MDKKCKDPIFGEMTYKHIWQKTETINMFGKKFDVTISASAYSEKPITKEQQDSYKNFKENELKILNKLELKITEYINSNKEDISVNSQDLSELLTPQILLFNQDGETIFLFDCVWDIEHGIGVNITSDYEIGSQDMFL